MLHGIGFPVWFSPSQGGGLANPAAPATHSTPSERLTRLGEVRDRARRWRQAAWLAVPFLLAMASWQPARAGDVVWSVGVGVPGVVLQAGTPYPVTYGWPTAPMPPRVVYVPPPPRHWDDEWSHRSPHHRHHHGYHHRPHDPHHHGSGHGYDREPQGHHRGAFGHR